MSDKKFDSSKITNEILLADAMIRVTALEKLLIKKGVLLADELQAEIDVLANQISESIMKSLRDPIIPTIDELVDQLSGEDKDKN